MRRAVQHLRDYDIRRSRWTRAFGVVSAALVLTAVLLAVVALVRSGDDADLVAAAGASAVVAFGAWQWWTRHESSLDHFYQRITAANMLFLEACRAVEQTALQETGNADQSAGSTVPNQVFEYYVFTELDNLEYQLVKYRRGYIGPDVASRAVRTFEDRCHPDGPFLAWHRQDFCGGSAAVGRSGPAEWPALELRPQHT
jgi:hypothetical protein